MRVVGYGYDVAGTRVSRTLDGAETRYLVDYQRPHVDVAEETSAAGTTAFTYGLDRLSADGPAGRVYHHGDRLGSLRLATGAGGMTAGTEAFDAFGRSLSRTGDVSSEFRFTGEARDPVTGLDYLRARSYDPATGRFTAADPYSRDPRDPVSLHRYLYAGADPVNGTDPSGRNTLAEVLTTLFIRTAIGAAIQGGIGLVASALIGTVTWKGPTYTLSVDTSSPQGITVGLTDYSSSKVDGKYTRALNLLTLVSVDAEFGSKDEDGPTSSAIPTVRGALGGVAGAAIKGFLGDGLGFDISIGDAEGLAPRLGGSGGTVVSPLPLAGFYLSGGFAVSLGAAGSALAYAGFGAGGKSSFGVSAFVQGFAIGVSIPDTSLSLAPSIGGGASAGFILPIPYPEFVDMVDDRSPG